MLRHKLPSAARRAFSTAAVASSAGALPPGVVRQVMSGIQPTGEVHLGNYLGALVSWSAMQDQELAVTQLDALARLEAAKAKALAKQVETAETAAAAVPVSAEGLLAAARLPASDSGVRGRKILCQVANLHAVTVPGNSPALLHNSRSIVATLLAMGQRREASAMFVQSHVPENSELCWLLQCATPVSWLLRMTQFKEKAQKMQEEAVAAAAAAGGDVEASAAAAAAEANNTTISQGLAAAGLSPAEAAAVSSASLAGVGMGLLTYPVLMAADILVYRATHVPCGLDQAQHLETARAIARAFDDQYSTASTGASTAPRGGKKKGKHGPLFPLPTGIFAAGSAKIMSLRQPGKKMSKSELQQASRVCLTDS